MSLSWTERVRAGSYALAGIGGYLLCIFCPPSLFALGALVLALCWLYRVDLAHVAGHVKPALAGFWERLKPKPKPMARALSSFREAARPASNVVQFFAGLVSFIAKHPVLVLGLVLLALLWAFGFPFGLGKSKGELRLEAELARAETRVRELEAARDADIAEIAQDVALLRRDIQTLSQRGSDEIEAARPANEAPIDAHVVSVWRANVERLCLYPGPNGNLADPCGSEP